MEKYLENSVRRCEIDIESLKIIMDSINSSSYSKVRDGNQISNGKS